MIIFFKYTAQTIRFCLYALMFSIPIGNAPVEIFSNLAIGILLIEWIVKGVMFVKQDSHSFSLYKIFKNPVFLAVIFYAFWNFLSAVFSINVSQSMAAVYKKMLEGVLLFCCCTSHIHKKKHFVWLFSMFFVSAFIMSIDGIFQWFTGSDFIRGRESFIRHDGTRVSAAFRHPNGFAGYLIAVLSLLLPFIFMPKQVVGKLDGLWRRVAVFFSCNSKFFIYPLSFLCLVVLGLTFSRGAWLGFFLGSLFFSLKSRRVFLSVLVVFLVFSAIFFPLFIQNRHVPFDVEKLMDSQNEFGKTEVRGFFYRLFQMVSSGRSVYWRDALYIAQDHPFVGSGLNTYSDVIKTYPNAFKGFYAHNCYLQMAAEIGFVGVGSFILVLFMFFFTFFQRIYSVKDEFLQFIAWGLAAGVIALCTHAFFDTIFYTVQLGTLHWIFMGLVLAIFRIEYVEK